MVNEFSPGPVCSCLTLVVGLCAKNVNSGPMTKQVRAAFGARSTLDHHTSSLMM